MLDERGFPLIILEAKSEDKNPLAGKEQARKYARGQNCGYVILSNGNIHYFWDIEKSNPSIITKYPSQQSVKNYSAYKPQPERLINEKISVDYIVLTQKPNYSQIPEYQDPKTREQNHNIIFFDGPSIQNPIKSDRLIYLSTSSVV